MHEDICSYVENISESRNLVEGIFIKIWFIKASSLG